MTGSGDRPGGGPGRPVATIWRAGLAWLAAIAGLAESAAARDIQIALKPSTQPVAGDTSTAWLITIFTASAALVALVALMLLIRRLKELNAARQDIDTAAMSINTMFAAGRAGTFTWLADGEVVASPGLASIFGVRRSSRLNFADIIATLDEDGRPALEAAVGKLREKGEAFELTVRGAEGDTHIFLAGRQVNADQGKADVLWAQGITEWMEDKLKAQEERDRLRGLLDALPVPIWSRDEQFAITECNLAYTEAVEADTRDEVISEGREITEGELAVAAKALARRALDVTAPQTESHHVVVGGSRRLLELTERPLNGTDQTVGFALDGTALEDARKEIQHVVEAHDEVLQNLALAIAVLGPDKRLKFFNAAYVTMWNHDEEWLTTGPEIGEILDTMRERRALPETGDFSAYKQDWYSYFTSLIEPRRELQHLPDGRAIWIVFSPHPLGGLMITFEDVTDKLAMERSYNTLIDVQRASLDNMSEGVAVFGEDGCLRLSNPVFEKVWNVSSDFAATEPHISDVIEKCKPMLDYGDDWERFKRSYVARITGRMTRTGRLYRKDDLVLAYGIVPLPDGGILLSFRDITDTTRVARALRERNEALEAADRIKSEFVANISYELRTPLNAIVGFTEILNNQYFGELNESQSEYIDGVLEASQRLIALIDDILDLAVIEAGRMVLDIKTIKVREMLANVVSLTGEWAREQDIKLELRCRRDIGLLEADERRVKHALFNLVSNAIKYTPPGGSIVISAERSDADMRLIVSDSGIGIPVEDQARVFDKFVRGRGRDDRSASAGLGLALVKSFIELHGGRVELESAPNEGTRIICRLPIKAAGGTGSDTVGQSSRDAAVAAE